MNFVTTLFCGLALCLAATAFSQNTPAPFTPNAAVEKRWQDAADKRLQADLSGLSGKYKKYLADIYKERHDMVRTYMDPKEIVSDSRASAYLEAVTALILKANPQLPSEGLRVVFARTPIPNASSMGEGTILFNAGLFHRLANESQMAFVLCHELAHYFLNHGNQDVERYVNTVYSDEFQKQLRKIQKSDYRKNQQLEALNTGLTFKTRRHSRAFEKQADSMALVYLKNTGFDLTESLHVLALLDSCDRDRFDHDPALPRRFHFAAYPFKKSWLESDAISFAKTEATDEDKATADSMKTHPDCKLRAATLAPTVAEWNRPGNRKFLVSEQQFKELVRAFDFDILNYCFETDRVTRSLYYSLEMLEEFPAEVALHTNVGRCLNELYKRQKAHQLGQVADLPGPAHDKAYNDLLKMAQNLRLREIAALSFHYLSQFENQFGTNPAFAAALRTAKENFSN